MGSLSKTWENENFSSYLRKHLPGPVDGLIRRVNVENAGALKATVHRASPSISCTQLQDVIFGQNCPFENLLAHFRGRVWLGK